MWIGPRALARVLGVAACTLAACAQHSAPPPALSTWEAPAVTELPQPLVASSRTQVLDQARRLLEASEYRVDDYVFSHDPLGFVRAAFWAAGLDLFSPATMVPGEDLDGMRALYGAMAYIDALHHEQPRVGDLVFLDGEPKATEETPRQVALVETVQADGTIVAVGHFGGKPARITLNLRDNTGTLLRAGSVAFNAAELYRSFANPY